MLAFIPKPDASCGVHNCINLEALNTNTFRGLQFSFFLLFLCNFSNAWYHLVFIILSSFGLIISPYVFFRDVSLIRNHKPYNDKLYNFNEFLLCPTIALHALATTYLHHLVLSHLTADITKLPISPLLLNYFRNTGILLVKD